MKMHISYSVVVLFLFSINNWAQNTNLKIETKTTTSTRTDSEGEHKTVKKETIKEVQNVELGKESPNTVNIPIKDSPITVTTSTKVTNPDGTTRTVNIDRSGYYISYGKIYKLSLDALGYTLTLDSNEPGLLRFTSTNSYVYRYQNKISIAYFDTNNDLIIETYNDQTDGILMKKFDLVK